MADRQAAKAKVKARVLVDTLGFKVNDVVEGELAEAAIAEGWGDGHRTAIVQAYREQRNRAAAR